MNYAFYVKKGIHRIRFCINMPQTTGTTREYPYRRQLILAWRAWCKYKYTKMPSIDLINNPNFNINQDEYGLVLEMEVRGRAMHINRSLDIYVDDKQEDLKRAIASIKIPKEPRPPKLDWGQSNDECDASEFDTY